MYELGNLLDNDNICVTSSMGPVKILEHQQCVADSQQTAAQAYFAHQVNVKKRQALIELHDSGFITSAGSMQATVGNVTLNTGVSGAGDYVGKLFSGVVTGSAAVKPEYYGTGYVLLEPTFRHLLLINVADWGSITLEDGLFLACSNTLQLNLAKRGSLKAAVAGGEGLFNLNVAGDGVLVLSSPMPLKNLVEITLQNDMLKVDGSMAIAWSGGLEFTVEKASKGIIASVASGEGFVNVFRGSGKVLMAL